jgi:hypothetical protein
MLPFGGVVEESVTKGDCGQKAVLAKAAVLCGGLENLAYVLDARSEDLCRWIAGVDTVPDAVIREAFVVVSSIRKPVNPSCQERPAPPTPSAGRWC